MQTNKPCKKCGLPFQRYNTIQSICIKCAIVKAKQDRIAKAKVDKEERLNLRERKKKLRGRSWHIKTAQAAFNAYVRERDYGQPCISSGREMNWNDTNGTIDAGHYRSRGSAPHLRFHLWNCHAQSVADNRWASGNNIEYRIRLVEKIGIERVEILESDNMDRKYSIEDLERIARIFRKKARILRNRRLQS
jgi:predicted Zn-ribbon and HTH transcriptional regulator